EDASTNIVPFGILIGGEELHNNHHAYASSAKLSNRWYEFDIGWFYIRILECLHLAKVKKIAPKVRYNYSKTLCDAETLQAIITHRYDVMAKFSRTFTAICREELSKLKISPSQSKESLSFFHQLLQADAKNLREKEQASLKEILNLSSVLSNLYNLRQDLSAVWARSTASQEQLIKQLNDWCHKAEASGIDAIRQFSKKLRCYAI
ncbi:MAG: transposase, partial [Pseudomonadota bacterium]|nr:transposase [Pseudomonadota bacterium]